MDLVPELGHLFGSFCFGYFGLTTLLQLGERGKQSFWVCPAVTLVLCHVIEAFCYHSLWAVESRILSAPCYFGLCYHHKAYMLPGIWLSAQNAELFCIDFEVSVATLLKNPSRLSRNIQEQSIWSSRLPQEMQRRSLGQTHTSSWDSISSNNLLVRRICCFHRWFLWEIRHQEGRLMAQI